MIEANDLPDVTKRVLATGKVEAADVLAVRRAVYGGDCLVTRAEAEAVFELERARKTYCSEWSEFFVEALTDFVLNQEQPVGYLSLANAAWVEAQIKRRREPSLDGDMELVANLIEKASSVPPSFSAFALRLAKDVVIYGDGPDGRNRRHKTGLVDEADIAMLKRILWGAGSEGLLAVSRDEAEALFAIADATTGAANVPEFDDLFAKAIGNYLIGATGRDVPSREDALRWDTGAFKAYKAETVSILHTVLASALGIAPQAVNALLHPRETAAFTFDTLRNNRTLNEEIEHEQGRRNIARDVEIEVAAIMTPSKSAWLAERIGKNGVTNGPERALLDFVARESQALGVNFEVAAT
jgi:hypothetical protein